MAAPLAYSGHNIRPSVALSIAVLLSILIHCWLFFLIKDWSVGFGAPVVNPFAPAYFKLNRPQFNPEVLKLPSPEPTSVTQPHPIQEDIPLNSSAAFEGPLKAPHIPIPKIVGMPTAPLSAGSATVPVEAFSALSPEFKGNFPTTAQALADEASTAALREATNALRQNNLAGGEGGTASFSGGASGLPKLDDIASTLSFRSNPNLMRPPFQPILLRLSSDVLFEFDSAVLQPGAIPTLQRVSEILTNAVRAKITIEGHTDTFGTDEYNNRLSLQRAQAVADWLKAQPGLQTRDFAVKGYGKSRPIVNPNGSIEEQKQNRRVEIRLEAEK